MSRKTREDLEIELRLDDETGAWNILSPAGAGILATYFEICLWKEIIRQRRQIAYLKARNNEMRQLLDTINRAKLA